MASKTKAAPKEKANANSKISVKEDTNASATDPILLDNILDKKLVKFDNKQQMSMFFVAYKSINALYKELADVANYTIPDEIIKRIVLETVPSIINEYNGNLKKRCRAAETASAAAVASASALVSNTIKEESGAGAGANASEIVVADETICLGRKMDGSQCTRKKYNNADFCKNHIKNLPNGRIPDVSASSASASASASADKPSIVEENANSNVPEEPLVEETKSKLKISKRGRKSKIVFDPRQYDNEYITLWEDIVEGEKVLVDNAGNVYTFDLEHPVYIGKKDITKIIGVRKIMDSIAASAASATAAVKK
jgi:hypothetical protein